LVVPAKPVVVAGTGRELGRRDVQPAMLAM
jgi:hypothetical protein